MAARESHFTVTLTHAEQDYFDAVVHVLREAWDAPLPLFSAQSRPAIGLLQRLGITVAAHKACDHYTVQDLWQAYAALIDKHTPPPDLRHAYRFIDWYQQVLSPISHAVVCLQEDCLPAALLYAGYHRFPMVPVRSIAEVVQTVEYLRPAYLTLVATIEYFPLATLQTLYNLLGEARSHQASWQSIASGTLTGRDSEAVSWAALKATGVASLLVPRQQVVTLLTTKERPTTTAHIYTRANSFEEIRAKLSQHKLDDDIPDLLLIESHGGEHLIHINKTSVICGAVPEEMLTKSEHSAFLLPPCACGQGCFKPDTLPAYTLTAKHILANSCNSFQIDSTAYPQRYTIGLNMLEGLALTYVGSLFLDDCKHSEIFFYAAALRAGLTVGEAVCLLNNVSKGYYPTLHTFLLAGNPQTQVLQVAPNVYRTSVHQEHDTWTIQVDVEEAVLITVDLPPVYEHGLDSLYCKSLPASMPLPEPLYYMFVAHHDRLTLYLYPIDGKIVRGHYVFAAGLLPLTEIQTRINHALTAYRQALLAHLLAEQTLKNRVRQIEQLSTKLTRQVALLVTHGETILQAIPALEDTIALLHEQLRLADQELLLDLLQNSVSGNPYRDKVVETFAPLSAPGDRLPCLCGDTLAQRRMQHVIFDYQLQAGFCPRCGFTHCGPVDGISLTWQHVSLPRDGEDWSVTARLSNSTRRPVEGYLGIVLRLPRLPKVYGKISYHPQQRQIILPPEQSTIEHFTLHTEGLIALDYEVYVYFVSGLAIHFMEREVFLAAHRQAFEPGRRDTSVL